MLSAAPLLMLCPSRTRPSNVRRLIADFIQTCTPGMTQLLIAVDNDDPTIDEYRLVEDECRDYDWVEFVYDERRRLGGTLNYLAPSYTDGHYAIGFLGDDHRPRTEGWDNQFLTALEQMKYGFVYGNDLYQGRNLPTQVAMTADIIDIMGYMVPRECTHLFFDDAWLALGKRLNKITYLPDVIIEHVHPLAGKTLSDPLYLEVNSHEMRRHDQDAFTKWSREQLASVVLGIEYYCNGLHEIDEKRTI